MAIHTAHSWVACLRTFITLSFVFTYSVSFFLKKNVNHIPFLFNDKALSFFFFTFFHSFVTGHHFFISFLFSTVHHFFLVWFGLSFFWDCICCSSTPCSKVYCKYSMFQGLLWLSEKFSFVSLRTLVVMMLLMHVHVQWICKPLNKRILSGKRNVATLFV